MSPTNFTPGRSAVNFRWTRSGRFAVSSRSVVIRNGRGWQATRPSLRTPPRRPQFPLRGGDARTRSANIVTSFLRSSENTQALPFKHGETFMTAPETTATGQIAIAPRSAGRMRVTQIATGLGVALAPAGFFTTLQIRSDLGIPNSGFLIFFWVAAVLMVASWTIAIVERPVKVRALAFLIGAIIVALPLYTIAADQISFRLALLVLSVVAQVLSLSGWLILRRRPIRSFAALPILLVSAASALAPSFVTAWVVLAIVPAGAAWVAFFIGRSAGGAEKGVGGVEKRAAAAASAEAGRIEANAQAIREWQAAFQLVNPGQPVAVIPPNYLTVPASASLRDHTNTLAILSLIFGILGGYLAIVFGHIAKSQIKRTDEKGSGLATAGLILGYSWVAVTLGFWIWIFALAMRH